MLLKIFNKLKNNEGFTGKSKLFVSPNHKMEDNSLDVDVEETDFSKNLNSFMDWVNKDGQFKSSDVKPPPETEFLLANFILFEHTWKKADNGGAVMKIYNSFNYTSDIKYEARILEIPLSQPLKLVMLLPSDNHLFKNLFARMTSEGFAAAVSSIQPIFTVSSKFKAPHFVVDSTVQVLETDRALKKAILVQYGSICVDKKGTVVRMLTCLSKPSECQPTICESLGPAIGPVSFCIISRDTPIITGQFTQQ